MSVHPLLQTGYRLLSLAVAAASLAACSTILRGTSQVIAVETPGAANATCELTGGDGAKATIVTPGSVKLSKSKRDVRVACVTPDGQKAAKTFASAYSNASYVQLPQAYLVDGVSGAMWEYPATLSVPFGQPAGASAVAPVPQTSVD